jgi:hypothetical protein
MDPLPDWIAVEQAKLVGLHPAFDPRVWDLREAERNLQHVAEEEVRRVDDLSALAEEIDILRQRIDEQGKVLLKLWALITEGEYGVHPTSDT